MFPFDEPESEDSQSSVLFEIPLTASSSGLVGPLVGLEEGLEDSCLCHLEPVPISGVKSGIWSSSSVELCSLLTSTSGQLIQVLLMWRQLGESLGEWSCFPFGGMARPAKGHPNKGVPARGMSGKEDTGGGTLLVEELEPQMDLESANHEAQAQLDRAWIWWRCCHPVEWLWLRPCLYSGKALPQKCTKVIT